MTFFIVFRALSMPVVTATSLSQFHAIPTAITDSKGRKNTTEAARTFMEALASEGLGALSQTVNGGTMFMRTDPIQMDDNARELLNIIGIDEDGYGNSAASDVATVANPCKRRKK